MKFITTYWHANRDHMIFRPEADSELSRRLADSPLRVVCDFYTVVSHQLNHESEIEFKLDFSIVTQSLTWLVEFHRWRQSLAPELQRLHEQGLGAMSLRHWADAVELLTEVQALHALIDAKANDGISA